MDPTIGFIYKSSASSHKRVDFGHGAYSDRIVLIGPDVAHAKVTRFFAPKGWNRSGLSHPWDEVVLVERGRAIVTVNGRPYVVMAGDTYLVSANQKFDLRVIEVFTARCVFTQAAGGEVPDDE